MDLSIAPSVEDVTHLLEGTAPEFCCERAGECGNEAVYRVLWMPENENAEGEPVEPCACGPHQYLMCITCFDLLTSRDGLVWCFACSPVGPHFFKTIIGSEPIRKGSM